MVPTTKTTVAAASQYRIRRLEMTPSLLWVARVSRIETPNAQLIVVRRQRDRLTMSVRPPVRWERTECSPSRSENSSRRGGSAGERPVGRPGSSREGRRDRLARIGCPVSQPVLVKRESRPSGPREQPTLPCSARVDEPNRRPSSECECPAVRRPGGSLYTRRDLRTIARRSCGAGLRTRVIDATGPDGFNSCTVDERRWTALIRRVARDVRSA